VRHWIDDAEAYTFDAYLEQRVVTITDQTGRVTRWTWNEDQQPTATRMAMARCGSSNGTRSGNWLARPTEVGRGRASMLGQIERTEWTGFYDLPVGETDPTNARWVYRLRPSVSMTCFEEERSTTRGARRNTSGCERSVLFGRRAN
jgi:YD repeat-containing protein